MAKTNKSSPSALKAENQCPHILEIDPKVVKCKDLKCKKKGVKKITFDVRFSITPEEKIIEVPLTNNGEKLSFWARPALCGGTLQLKLKKLKRCASNPYKKLTVQERENFLKSFLNSIKYSVEWEIYKFKIRMGIESNGKKRNRKNTPLTIYLAGSPTEPCWFFHAGKNGMLIGQCKPVLSIKTQRIGKAGPCKFSYEFNTTNTGDWVVEANIPRLSLLHPIKSLLTRCKIRYECEKAVSSYYSKHSIPSKGAWKCPIGR